MTFLTTSSLGMSLLVPSVAILVSIAAEIGAFWVARPLVTGSRARWALVAVMAVSALRWFVMSSAVDAWALIAIQVLHFFSFGVWYAASIVVLSDYAPPAQRGAIQGLFAAMVFGIGGSAGSMLGGEIADMWGSASGFTMAAILDLDAMLGCVLLAAGQRPKTT